MFDFWKEYREMQQSLSAVSARIQGDLRLDAAPEIEAAIRQFSTNGGKMVRPALFLLFAGLDKPVKSASELTEIASSLELLHLATLIHDDIIDDAPVRRKMPTVQATLGKDTAVYAGDFIYTVYFENIVRNLSDTPFLAINAAAMRRILTGELQQKAQTFDAETPVLHYLRAIKGKTAELISLACEEGAYFAGLTGAEIRLAKRIGRNIGLAFQIYDDILNFSLEFKNEKPILTDVTQGIYTLPLLIARDREPAAISKFLENPETLSRQELIALAELVKRCGALDTALDSAKRLTDKALSDIAQLPSGPNRDILRRATKKTAAEGELMEAYNEASNPMMRRPVLSAEIVELLRTRQKPLSGALKALQDFAADNNVPVIPQETVNFFQFLLPLLQPKKILEIGTAIGFSTRVIAECCPSAEITTLERYEEMLVQARKNLSGLTNVTLLEGDASELLSELPDATYDVIFMDSAKTQYVKFLPELLRVMSDGGCIFIDDVFQAGDVMRELTDLPRRARNIIKGLNKLFDATLDVPELTSSLVPLGDGILMVRRA